MGCHDRNRNFNVLHISFDCEIDAKVKSVNCDDCHERTCYGWNFFVFRYDGLHWCWPYFIRNYLHFQERILGPGILIVLTFFYLAVFYLEIQITIRERAIYKI